MPFVSMKLWHGTTMRRWDMILTSGLYQHSPLAERLCMSYYFAIGKSLRDVADVAILEVNGKYGRDFVRMRDVPSLSFYSQGYGKFYETIRILPAKRIKLVDVVSRVEAMSAWRRDMNETLQNYKKHLEAKRPHLVRNF